MRTILRPNKILAFFCYRSTGFKLNSEYGQIANTALRESSLSIESIAFCQSRVDRFRRIQSRPKN